MIEAIEFLNSKKGITLVSILWGLALACMFYKVCQDDTCLIIEGPNPKEVEQNSYKYNGSCYKYKIVPAQCNSPQ